LIDFRYHIVSLVAVFLALALGLFLGSTTLQSTVTHNLQRQADRVTSLNQQLKTRNSQLSGELGHEHTFVADIERYAVAGRLPGAGVAVVSAPGVSGDDRQAMDTTLALAGATVTADVQLQPGYLDPTQDAELGGLANQLRLPGRTLPSGDGSTRVSAELAAVLATRPGRPAVSRATTQATLSALSAGKFISVAGDPPAHPATITVLLAPAPSPAVSATTAQTQNSILLTLAAKLRASSSTTVLAARSTTPPIAGGILAAAAADAAVSKSVSTVDLGDDDADPAAGRIAVVLALAAAPSSKVGSYGLSLSPPVPTASASP
jgi:hypothetical protein